MKQEVTIVQKLVLTIKMARAPVVLNRGQSIFSEFPGDKIQRSCYFSPSYSFACDV